MSLTGTTALLRAALRRDRVLLVVWVGFLTAMAGVSAFSIENLYTSDAERVAAARLIDQSPGLVALYGPILNQHSAGELAMSKMTVMYALFVMGMALVLVRRHTRTEEESGRADLVGATAVGPDAPLAAALLLAGGAALALGVLGALSDIVAGLPVAGSVAFGSSWLGTGLVGTGIAAVAVQVSASTRTCGGVAVAVIGALDALRAAGDTGPDTLGWLSPLGWNTRLDAWGATRWWVLGLYVAATLVLLVAAGALSRRRDLGSGLVPDRPGPADGTLASQPDLVWRLHRLAVAWWAVGALAMGVVFGSIAPHLGSLFDTPAGKAALEALGGRGQLQEVLLAALLAVMAAVMTGFAIMVVASAGHEEHEGHTSFVLAAGGSRARQFLSVAGMTVVGISVLMLSYAVGSAVGFGLQSGGVGSALVMLVPAAAAHLPAIFVVAALALLGWALRPEWSWVGWALLFGFVTLGEFGQLLKLPTWVQGISPYWHVVKVPAQHVAWGPELVLVAIALAVAGLAWLRFRSRDIG